MESTKSDSCSSKPASVRFTVVKTKPLKNNISSSLSNLNLLEAENEFDNDDVFEGGESRLNFRRSISNNTSRNRSYSDPQNNKRRQIKLKIFLAMLALCIILVTVLVWHFYSFNSVIVVSEGNITFAQIDTANNEMEVFAVNGQAIVKVSFGSSERVSGKFSYLKECNSTNNVCLTWEIDNSILIVTGKEFRESATRCVKIQWKFNNKIAPKDCIHLLNDESDVSPILFGNPDFILWHSNSTKNYSISCFPYIPGSFSTVDPFGNILKFKGGSVIEPTWYISNGVALKASTHHAVNVCQNFTYSNDPKLCLEPIFDQTHFNMFHADDGYHLDYMICVADSLEKVVDNTMKMFLKPNKNSLHKAGMSFKNMINDGVYFEDKLDSTNEGLFVPSTTLVSTCDHLIKKPVWNFAYSSPSINIGLVKLYLGSLQHIGGSFHFNNVSQVYTKLGEFQFQNDTFYKEENFFTVATSFGFDLLLPITLFINYDAKNFETAALNKYFVKSVNTDAPLLISFPQSDRLNPGIVDLTSFKAAEWYRGLINDLYNRTNASFQFYYGQSTWLPKDVYNFTQPLHNAGHFSTLYANLAAKTSRCSITDVAYDSQNLNQFVLLNPSQNLRETLSSALAAGLAGYPFVLANFPSSLKEAYKHMDPGVLNDGIVRWIEMISFFPVVHIPWDFEIFQKLDKDLINSVVNWTEHYLSIRNSDFVGPKIKAAFYNAEVYRNQSVISPMWMAPGVSSSVDYMKILLLEDQFMIGPDMFVAPILDIDAIVRTIFVPPGKWKDIVNHIIIETETGRWIYNYKVDLFNIPVFIRTDSFYNM